MLNIVKIRSQIYILTDSKYEEHEKNLNRQRKSSYKKVIFVNVQKVQTLTTEYLCKIIFTCKNILMFF